MAYPSYYSSRNHYRPLSKRAKTICACVPIFGWHALLCDKIGTHMRNQTLKDGAAMWERVENGTFHPSLGLHPSSNNSSHPPKSVL